MNQFPRFHELEHVKLTELTRAGYLYLYLEGNSPQIHNIMSSGPVSPLRAP